MKKLYEVSPNIAFLYYGDEVGDEAIEKTIELLKKIHEGELEDLRFKEIESVEDDCEFEWDEDYEVYTDDGSEKSLAIIKEEINIGKKEKDAIEFLTNLGYTVK